MSSMPGGLPRPPVGCSWSWRYSNNQTAIFAPLTRVNTPHHQARGFDLAREPDRAGHSKLIGVAPRVTEPTFACSNSVINRDPSRQKSGDWPEHVPVTEAEIEVLEAWFGELCS